MWGWKTLERVVVVLVVGFVGAMVLGQVLGQPVLLGYVTSNSMAPALSAGDGFVAVPPALAGPVTAGDVVTFRAEELNDGGLTTHRVVERTDRGFVTKGDANPFTDQDGDEPPVKREQVVAVAWRPGGHLVAIPGVGTVVEGTQAALAGTQRWLASALNTPALLGTNGLAYIVFAVSMLWYLFEVYRDRGPSRDRSRSRSRRDGVDPRLVVGGMALVVVGAATAAMVVPAGTQKFDVVSSEVDAPGPRVIESGTSESFAYPVDNAGVVPIHAVVEPASDGVAVADGRQYVPGRSVREATVTLSAPPETGYYRRFVAEHRYLAVLPPAHLRTMHGVHPWLPVVVIDLLLGGGFYLGGRAVVGTGRIRSRSRDAPGGLVHRLRRWAA